MKWSASSAAFPRLVPESHLARANGLSGSVSQGAWLLGTLVGGVLVAQVGPPTALLLDGLSFLLMAGLLTLVRLPHLPAEKPGSDVLEDVRAGLRLMRRSKVLSLVPLIGLVVNAATAPVLVGFVMLGVAAVWYIYRIARGRPRLAEGRVMFF